MKVSRLAGVETMMVNLNTVTFISTKSQNKLCFDPKKETKTKNTKKYKNIQME